MRKKTSMSTIIIFIGMSIMTATFLYPLVYMTLNAMKTKQEYYKNSFSFPSSFNLTNFKLIITDFNILVYFKSSLIVAVTSTLLIVILAIFSSYAFAKLKFKYKTAVYLGILATMFLPAQVSMIPAYVMFSKLGLIDNYWSVILSYLAGGLPGAILLLYSSFRGISNEMLESARIDGAGYFGTVRNMILPLALAPISIVIIFNFIGFWNDLLTPMLYLTSQTKQTVMVALVALVQRGSSLPTYQLAGLLVSVAPAIVLYLFLQKYFVDGITAGGIK